MTTLTTIKRQFITDAGGQPIGVLLPIEEFVLVEQILTARLHEIDDEDKLKQMEQAVKDPRFLADMRATMDAFKHVDAEWWERTE